MRVIISILLLPLIYFYGVHLIELVGAVSLSHPHQSAFIYTLAGSALVFFLILRGGSYFALFEHELTHNLFGLLTFQKPVGFHVERGRGGYFQYQGKGNVLMTLAPYFFLTLSFIALLFYGVLKAEYHQYFFMALGLFTGYHTSSTLKETRLSQPDIRQYGALFSFIVIIFGNVLCYGLILAFTLEQWPGFVSFLKNGALDFWVAGKWLWQEAGTLIIV